MAWLITNKAAATAVANDNNDDLIKKPKKEKTIKIRANMISRDIHERLIFAKSNIPLEGRPASVATASIPARTNAGEIILIWLALIMLSSQAVFMGEKKPIIYRPAPVPPRKKFNTACHCQWFCFFLEIISCIRNFNR